MILIKFRAWIKDQKKMRVVNDLTMNNVESDPVGINDCQHENCATCVDWYEYEDVEIMQAIGRKCQDDNFVYENDVVSVVVQGYVFGFYQETEYIGIVKYDDKDCIFYVELLEKPIEGGEEIPDEVDGISISKDYEEEISRFYFSDEIESSDIKILGNTYENPELIK